MRAPPAGHRPSTVRRCAPAAAAPPADNSLALAQPPDIICGQRGKGGGPTACIAVGLARWLSASRRPAGAPAVVSARRCDHWPSLAPPHGRGRRAARRRPANTRQTPSPRVGRPCPAGPRVACLASRGARFRADAVRMVIREAPGGLYFPPLFSWRSIFLPGDPSSAGPRCIPPRSPVRAACGRLRPTAHSGWAQAPAVRLSCADR